MPPKNKPHATPASTKKKKQPVGDDVEDLVNLMTELTFKLPSDEVRGRNFACPFPYRWEVYTVSGHRYLKMTFLSCGLMRKDFGPLMSKDGKVLSISVILPPVFLDPKVLFKYHYVVLEQGGGSDNMYEATAVNCKAIKEDFDMQPVKIKLNIKLPFKCLQTFEDPYNQTGGYEHLDYPYKAKPDQIEDPGHPGQFIDAPDTRAPEERDTRVYMLHTTMKAADELRQEHVPTGRRFV